MPVRARKKAATKKHSYEYEELLRYIRKHIDERFGGVTAFLNSDSFVNAGFVDTDKERAKMSTYLSLPKEGETSRVKSYPVLRKLYAHLLNIKVDSEIVVTREQTLVTDKILE